MNKSSKREAKPYAAVKKLGPFHFRVFRKGVLQILEVIDTPVSLGLYLRCMRGVPDDWPTCNPLDYEDPSHYLRDAQALALLKKNPWFFPKSNNAAEKATSTFLDCEAICHQTNLEISERRVFSKMENLAGILHTARHFCTQILGPFSFGTIAFGPGTTFCSTGKNSDLIAKLCTKPESTQLAYDHVVTQVLTQMPLYAISCGMIERTRGSVSLVDRKVPIVDGNRFSLVPKDISTDRPICIEPLGNMLLQKGVGDKIRSRLKKFGYDLDHLPELHDVYAREGSLTDCYATIDLSSASDTVAFELVREILPFEWFYELCKLRSPKTKINGRWLTNEKFSSMGNGYTFELETLIFLSICLAIRQLYGKKEMLCSVFGDDIIVSTELAPRVIECLRALGFTPNPRKTFTSGPFRESCGKDYFNGNPVRPVFLKELPNDEILASYYLANRVREIARCLNFGMCCDNALRHVWQRLIRLIPKPLRFFGPPSLGDQVIICDQPKRIEVHNGCLRVSRIDVVRQRKKFPRSRDLALACALYGIDSTGLTPRGAGVIGIRQRYAFPVAWGGSDLRWS